jgi:hypothetical protein
MLTILRTKLIHIIYKIQFVPRREQSVISLEGKSVTAV